MGYPTKNETYSKVFAMKELVLQFGLRIMQLKVRCSYHFAITILTAGPISPSISSEATLSSPESVVEPGPSASEEALARGKF